MEESKHYKLWLALLSGLGGAFIAAIVTIAVTYWSAVDKSKNEAALNKALADSKEQYLEQIKDSIGKIARSEANAENAVISSQKFIVRLATLEERAKEMLRNLNEIGKEYEKQAVHLDDESTEKVKKSLVNEIASIQIPPGAVIPFNSSTCPDDSWEEFSGAYGRFIRGIDRTGRVDPDGIRLPGSHQNDAFKTHTHKLVNNNMLSGGSNDGPHSPWVASNGDSVTGSPTGDSSNETRPKNVALLFCIKKG